MKEVLDAMKNSEEFQFFTELHELVHVEGLRFTTVMAAAAGRMYFACGLDLLYRCDGKHIEFLSLESVKKNFLV